MELKDIMFWFWIISTGLFSANCENYTISSIRNRRQSSFKCTLPPQLNNGRWLVPLADVKPGDQIEINTIIRLECHEGYQLYPSIPYHLCDSRWNIADFPTCKKKCPPFYSTSTTKITCKDSNDFQISCDKATDGIYLTYNCGAYYEIPPGGRNILYCNDGAWDFPKPVCQPVCGRRVNKETIALIWGGFDVKDFEYPWVVAVYNNLEGKYENSCGGTLISRKVVVTAAHCVTDIYGNAYGKQHFRVAAGKFYNAYGDERDIHAQYREISKVIVSQGYRGESQKYIADVAILVTEKLFKLDPIVQPVCIDNVNKIYLKNQQIGEVAGWGLTEEEKPSDTLKSIRIPYKDGPTCAKELPETWEQQYNFFDKICAGRRNESIAVCKGDSGSGLVFKNPEDNRYYIHGIVSIAPKLYGSRCNHQTNSLYTSTAFYYSFIKREMTKHYLEDCILPEYPKNGKWFLEGGVEKKPGDIVLSSTVLRFSCNMQHLISTVSPYFDCDSIKYHPTCLKICPQLSLPSGTQMLCKNTKEQLIDCTDIADGSSVMFTCPKGFVTDRGSLTSTRYCRNGVYINSEPSCVDIIQKPAYVSNTLYKSKTKMPVTSNTSVSIKMNNQNLK